MKHIIATLLFLCLTPLYSGTQAADSIDSLKTQNVYLKSALKDLKSQPLTKTMDDPICVCGGDGKGGWSCTPKSCDSSFNYFQSPTIKNLSRSNPSALAADPICICGGDGEGGWNCVPKNCDSNMAPSTPDLNRLDTRRLQRKTLDTRKLSHQKPPLR